MVIFDEASQVKQADAIPPIMRASQVIVAGDKKQLPPTDFFSSAADDEDDETQTTWLSKPAASPYHAPAGPSTRSSTRSAQCWQTRP